MTHFTCCKKLNWVHVGALFALPQPLGLSLPPFLSVQCRRKLWTLSRKGPLAFYSKDDMIGQIVASTSFQFNPGPSHSLPSILGITGTHYGQDLPSDPHLILAPLLWMQHQSILGTQCSARQDWDPREVARWAVLAPGREDMP